MKKNYREKHYFEPSQEDENLCRCGLPMNIPSMHHKPSEEKAVERWEATIDHDLKLWGVESEVGRKAFTEWFHKEIQKARIDEKKYIGKIRREAYQRGYDRKTIYYCF